MYWMASCMIYKTQLIKVQFDIRITHYDSSGPLPCMTCSAMDCVEDFEAVLWMFFVDIKHGNAWIALLCKCILQSWIHYVIATQISFQSEMSLSNPWLGQTCLGDCVCQDHIGLRQVSHADWKCACDSNAHVRYGSNVITWSPSQSEPLIVSYACHRQSSSDIFPRAALMPPCAATVCDLVGNSFVMHLQNFMRRAASLSFERQRENQKVPLLSLTQVSICSVWWEMWVKLYVVYCPVSHWCLSLKLLETKNESPNIYKYFVI